jgi:hypothetical protein
MNIRPAKVELLHAHRRADGQTDVTKIIVVFRNLANAPNKIVNGALRDVVHVIQQGVLYF